MIADDITPRGVVTVPFSNGMYVDTLITGDPNLVAPHLKLLFILAKDTLTNTPDAVPFAKNVVITGARATAANFELVTPELPMMILRNPPGDQSFSFVEQTQTQSTVTKWFARAGGSVNLWRSLKVGSKFEAGTIGFTTESKFWNEGTADITMSHRRGRSGEVLTETSSTSRFQTSTNPIITGSDGDLVIGASIVMNYSTADVLTINNCSPDLTREFVIQPDRVNSQYFLRTGHIERNIIPELEARVANPPMPDSLLYYQDQLNIWKQLLIYNDSLKQQAIPFEDAFGPNGSIPPNITLGDNVGVDYRVSSRSTRALTLEFLTEIDAGVALESGMEVAGSGAGAGVTVRLKAELGGASTETNTNVFTTGFHLGDNTIGDGYNMSIASDPVFKTPVFTLNSGQTACPWEPGTQSRDRVTLTATNPIQTNIPDGGVRSFNLQVGNISETGETRSYYLRFNQNSNSGAAITVGGSPYVGPVLISNIPVNSSVNVNVTIRQDNPNTFAYEGLEFEAYPTCNISVINPQISDKALISAFFVNPCTDINMAAPTDWIVNSAMSTIPIKINGCLLYTSPSPRDRTRSRMPSSA